MNNIAIMHEVRGDMEKARSCYQTSMKIQKDILGESHPSYAATLNNLGVVEKNLKNYGKAVKYFD